MTGLAAALSAFTSVDVGQWPGLPAEVRLSELEGLLGFDPADRRRGDAGDPRRTRLWVPAQAPTFHGGLRLWLADDAQELGDARVVLLEGLTPLDASGDPLIAPASGPREATYDAVLGPFHVEDAERVYAGRGLVLQVNPENEVLVAMLGFAPTDLDDYRTRLQPHREPLRPLARPVTP